MELTPGQGCNKCRPVMIKMFDPECILDEDPLLFPSPGQALREDDLECEMVDALPEPTPAPPPDPRSPIQKLLERFDLEEDIEARAQLAYWNQTELPENVERHNELMKELQNPQPVPQDLPPDLAALPQEEIENMQAQKLMDAASQLRVEPLPSLAVDTDADVHISESAIPFPRWHLDAESLTTMTYPPNADGTLPEEYRSPLPVAEPWRPLSQIDAGGPSTTDPHARIVECIRLARSMIPEVPVKAKGKKGVAPAGTLGWTAYGARGTEGWMYIEDNQSEYGAWFQELVHRRYRDAKEVYAQRVADPSATGKARLDARYEMRQAAACIAVSNQEGAPSAINTYDGLVLSWGIGIAGPGKLPQTFYHIMKDPRVYKAFYLCGFRFDGSFMNGDYHGAYQIVDLAGRAPEDKAAEPAPAPPPKKPASPQPQGWKPPPPPPPGVVYRDQWSHKPKAKRYDFEGHAYKVLKYMTSQPKLIHLLIQLAKDPLTRGVIFEPNYRMIQGFVAFVRGEEIHTDALHLFAAQVKHNWGLGPAIVGWAVSRFDDDERRLLPPQGETSEEKDRAIAKGIVRYLMGRLQEQRWKRGIKLMELENKGKLKDPTQTAKGKRLYQLPATTEFGFTRLIDNYWKPLQEGVPAQTKSKEVSGAGLSVPGFPVEIGTPRKAGRYVWIQEPPKKGTNSVETNLKFFDLGPLSQFDLLFPHEEIRMLDLQGDVVLIQDGTERREVPRDLAPTRGGAR